MAIVLVARAIVPSVPSGAWVPLAGVGSDEVPITLACASVLGLAWLIVMFWLEHSLRTGMQRGQLARRAIRGLVPLAATLAVVMAIPVLL